VQFARRKAPRFTFRKMGLRLGKRMNGNKSKFNKGIDQREERENI